MKSKGVKLLIILTLPLGAIIYFKWDKKIPISSISINPTRIISKSNIGSPEEEKLVLPKRIENLKKLPSKDKEKTLESLELQLENDEKYIEYLRNDPEFDPNPNEVESLRENIDNTRRKIDQMTSREKH